MKTTRTLLVMFLISGSMLRAEVIDRIVAVVSRHVITLSDVRRERQIRLALDDYQATDDNSIIRYLIDGQIIEEQIAQFPDIEITDIDVDSEMSGITDMHGLSAEILRDAVRKRIRTSEFFNLRFRQFLQASDPEVRQYYEDVFVPEARKRGLNPIPPLEDISVEVRRNVLAEKVTHDVESWLTAIRRRTDIEIFQ